MTEPLTKEDALADLRTCQHISSMRVIPTSPKFALFLHDSAFATAARTVVKARIAALSMPEIKFPTPSARRNTLQGWQRLLARIDESLYQDGPKR